MHPFLELFLIAGEESCQLCIVIGAQCATVSNVKLTTVLGVISTVTIAV